MSKILNAEKAKKTEVVVKPASKVTLTVLNVLKTNGYITGFSENKEDYSIKIEIGGNINKCGAISPNFNVKASEFDFYEKRYLPAKDFGILIITTPEGIMTNNEAKEKKTGGRLLAYCY